MVCLRDTPAGPSVVGPHASSGRLTGVTRITLRKCARALPPPKARPMLGAEDWGGAGTASDVPPGRKEHMSMSDQGLVSGATRDPRDVWSSIDTGRRRARLLVPLVVAALVAAGLAVSVGPALGGETAALGRLALGTLGLAAAALLRARPALGYRLALAWAALQVPFVAWTPEGGSPTTQLLAVPLSFTSATTVNGATTSYLAVGVNLVGVALVILLRQQRQTFSARE